MQIKNKLVFIRAKMNLSQEALARKFNVSFATINRWEQGHTKPSKRYVALIDSFCVENNIVLDKGGNDEE